MTPKEYLLRIGIYRRKIIQKQELLKDANAVIGIQGKKGDDPERVQTSFFGSGNNTTMQQALRILELKEEINDDIITYLEKINKMVSQIHKIDDSICIDILYKRYVQEENRFEKIASDMGYSYQYIINKHGEGLKRFEEKFPELFQDVIKCEDTGKKTC